RKDDCFRQAANKIYASCDKLDLDEQARVRGAVLMTLCELNTIAHYAIPMECTSFSKFSPDATLDDIPSAPCVGAISRSTQSWSSYSGYLRDIR
ncbi:hypothetical protein K488DRAFT_7097, partial [Vararia minispora EC-137]